MRRHKMAQRLLKRNTHSSACHWPQKSLKAPFPYGRRNAFPGSAVSTSDGEGFAWTASQYVLKSSCSMMFWKALWLHGVSGCTNPTRDCWSCLSLSPPSTAFAKCCKRGDSLLWTGWFDIRWNNRWYGYPKWKSLESYLDSCSLPCGLWDMRSQGAEEGISTITVGIQCHSPRTPWGVLGYAHVPLSSSCINRS